MTLLRIECPANPAIILPAVVGTLLVRAVILQAVMADPMLCRIFGNPALILRVMVERLLVLSFIFEVIMAK